MISHVVNWTWMGLKRTHLFFRSNYHFWYAREYNGLVP